MNPFHFLRPWYLLLAVPVVLIYLQNLALRRPSIQWKKVIHPVLYQSMLVKGKKQTWFNPINTIFLVSILSILSLAGPAWNQKATPFSKDEASLIIILDVSSSMNKTDIQPSRLERVKHKISSLIKKRGNSKTALIAYAGTAHTIVPLTDDPEIILHYLHSLNTKIMPVNGKSPEKVLSLAGRMLEQTKISGTLLLVSDSIGPKSLKSFEKFFKQYGHQLIVWGVGSKTASDKNANQPLQEKGLKSLSDRSNGRYQKITIDKTDIETIYNWIENYFVVAMDEKGFIPWIDNGYFLNFLILPLYILWFRKGWTLTWGIIFILLTPGLSSNAQAGEFSFIDLWMTADQQGYYYFEKKRYKIAAERFENIYWKGLAHYKARNFKEAIVLFDEIETPLGYFALGNALAHNGHYNLAIESYQQILKTDPNNEAALQNIFVIKGLMNDIAKLIHTQPNNPPPVRLRLDSKIQKKQTRKAKTKKIEQFTAGQILGNKELRELWMRDVQKDPARFLSAKFEMQLRQQPLNTKKEVNKAK